MLALCMKETAHDANDTLTLGMGAALASVPAPLDATPPSL
jgi:hypothetical protein